VRLLVVAATAAEVSPFLAELPRVAGSGPRMTRYRSARHDIDLLVSGVGMVATSAWCSRALAAARFDAALNLGVCGSFRAALSPGTVVNVVSDRIAEMGAEDGEALITVQQMNLVGDDEFPFKNGRLVNASAPPFSAFSSLPAVDGITVNTVHGRDRSIARVVEHFDPDVETMEGAAFMYACLIHGVPFAQVRAVSNMVERRNRAAWKMNEAVESLAAVARRMLE
jgi:futalosine hydrolase